MLISDIELTNFRNYKKVKIKLNDGINIFYGDNAQGKTNILESIYVCAIGKSFRTRKDKDLIYIGEEQASVNVKYKKRDRDGEINIDISKQKSIKLNGIKINKLSELIGNIVVVTFTPEDIGILKNGPANRRHFLDMLIGQLRPAYIYDLNMYLKILEQRNIYLRQIKIENKSEDMLDIWDEKLAEYADKVYKYRTEFIKKIKDKINIIHKNITDNKEEIQISFNTSYVNKSQFINLLKEHRRVDIIRGVTSKGIHRDDFEIYINNKPISIYGSQGQFRTSVLSLKISELQVIYDEIGEYPILLLDDFMSELDEKRRKSFIKFIDKVQVIITCTDKINIDKSDYSCFNVKKGKIIEQST